MRAHISPINVWALKPLFSLRHCFRVWTSVGLVGFKFGFYVLDDVLTKEVYYKVMKQNFPSCSVAIGLFPFLLHIHSLPYTQSRQGPDNVLNYSPPCYICCLEQLSGKGLYISTPEYKTERGDHNTVEQLLEEIPRCLYSEDCGTVDIYWYFYYNVFFLIKFIRL